MARKLLMIEDEADFADVVAMNLRRNGFDVVLARSGEVGVIEARRQRPEIIILDLNLPDIPGTEVCRRVKGDSLTRSIPLIMVTARGEEIDRVIGLELGADDYMVKPISVRELVLRVNAVLRRAETPGDVEPSVTAGPLRIDGSGHRVFADGREVAVTALEFKLLLALVTRPGRALSRENLLGHVWGIQAEIETRTVDTMMKRLRDKLGDAGRCIETVRGVGYRFDVES